MPIQKKNLQLRLLREFATVVAHCELVASKTESIVSFYFDKENYILYFKDKDPESTFFFTVSHPFQDTSSKFMISVQKAPKGEHSIKETGYSLEMGKVAIDLEKWINIIEDYNGIKIGQGDRFEKFYEEEYYTDFQILEDDSDSMPFDRDRQEHAVLLLDALQDAVQNHPDQDLKTNQILSDINALKKSVPLLPKNKVARGIAKIAAQIKMKGPDYAKAIWKEVKKQGVAFLLKKGFEWAWTTVAENIHLLH